MSAAIPLSILDLCPVPTGVSTGDALRRSLDLAQRAEQLGYHRYWVAEHHGMPGIASSSPAVLIGQIAAATESIRVGSGGVMLPNHAPLVVAEQFGMLEALYPGRVDLGLGRAPGTDQVTALALRRSVEALTADDFPEQLGALFAYFAGEQRFGPQQLRVRAIPAEGNQPAVWLLGSSGYSAQVAGILGLPFAFAHHFSSANTEPALDLYRQSFRPSQWLEQPYGLIGVAAICADDGDRARWLQGSGKLSMLRLRTGHPSTLPSPEEAAEYAFSAADEAIVAATTGSHVVGDTDEVIVGLLELAERTGADEMMITTNAYRHEDRVRSYELIAAGARLQAASAAQIDESLSGPSDQGAYLVARSSAMAQPNAMSTSPRS